MATSAEEYARDSRLIANATKFRYNPMVVDHADGARLYDVDGREYLDFGGSWSLASLGYSNEHVRQAIESQLRKTTFAGLVSSINRPALDLAEKLVSLMGGDFEKKVWYGLAGSDAAEAAQRLILTATGKRRIVSFIGGWHGTSDASMSLSAHPALSGQIAGAHVTKVPYPDPYHNPLGCAPGELTDRTLSYLEDYIFATICPPEDTAAIFVETIQADSGDIVPPPDFLPRLRALCDRLQILLLVDDIKIGLGRTGRMFSYEHSDIDPDVLILGKSLGGGQPLSAIVARAELLDEGFAGFTAVGNATGCAAGLATIEVIEQEGLVELSAQNGRHLQQQLQQTLGRYEIVGDIRGLGMIQGIELVKDRATKEPHREAAAKIIYRAWELGLVCYYAGYWGSVIEITPPLILTGEEIERGVAILGQATQDFVDGKISDESVADFAGWG